MTRGRITPALSLAISAGLVLAPAVAVAGASHGKVPGVVAPGRPSRVQQGIRAVAAPPQPVVPQGVGPRPFVQRTITFGVFAAPIIYTPPAYPYNVVVTHAPPVSDEPPLSYAPSVSYAPPGSYPPPPVSYGPDMSDAISMAPSPPPPMPSVVEFPTGRYALYGDGTATPYTWVWIPNPPTAPPAPPAAPPSQAPDPDDPPGSAGRQLYRWTDEGGVAYWTDRLDAIPQQYRAEAEQPRLR